jgi:5-methylcytosine-specific restriction endonuclease McrA
MPFLKSGGLYSREEAKLLVREKIRKSKSEVNYLKFRINNPEADLEYERLPIPEDVRNSVWRRDEGKCVRCGSVRNLEFDHLIPVTKGGSNTARNLQLLCETCNRKKSDSIG